MEEKSFLPDGSPIRARLLARAPYSQDAMERIASGANPSSLEASPAANPAWGVLYVSDSCSGFFSARVEPSMLGFSLNAGADQGGPIHLQFPGDGSTTLEITRAKRLPGRLGSRISRFLALDDVVSIRWNGADGPRAIRFLVTDGDIDGFERAFRANA